MANMRDQDQANVIHWSYLLRGNTRCRRINAIRSHICQYLIIIHSNETLKGVISLCGTQIIKGDLQIKLPNYHSQIKVGISESNPYHLEQAKHCQNYVHLAIDLIERTPTPTSIASVSNHLANILKLVKQAQLAFNVLSEAKSFPYRVCQPRHFSPPLPEDLVVEISIDRIHILCNVFGLELHPIQRSDKYLPYKDKYALVLDECRVRTQSPILTDVETSLTKVSDICSEFQLKLTQISALID
ncbi:unnamed protein product [Umbelopsis sp. WA50703]